MNEDKKVFKTMIEPKPETVARCLTGWREPKTAYVLLETKVYHLGADGNGHWGTGLMTLDVEGRPEQRPVIEEMLDARKARVIHYGNFPRHNDNDPDRAKKAKLYSQESGRNPWALLENWLLAKMRLNPDWEDEMAGAKEQISTLEAKVEELTRQLAAKQKQPPATPTKEERA